MEKNRYLTSNIVDDLNDKMVFIGGARQVGKTTLAKNIISKKFKASNYYNWDFPPDRKKITKFEFPGESGLLIFDEIHKYKKWKTTIKGLFDTYKDKYKILVTGSARMNIFRKGGDSLQGRYHYYNLHPFSLAEMLNIENNFLPIEELPIQSNYYPNEIEMLLKFGGFPEVLIKQNSRVLRRWHNEKLERLFREDIRDVENIRDINSMKLLGDLLPEKAANLKKTVASFVDLAKRSLIGSGIQMDLHSTRTGQIHGNDLRLDRAAVRVRPGSRILSPRPPR